MAGMNMPETEWLLKKNNCSHYVEYYRSRFLLINILSWNQKHF